MQDVACRELQRCPLLNYTEPPELSEETHMPPPRSLTGLVASIEVRQDDLYSALKSVKPHIADGDDIPALGHARLTIEPDRMAYLYATDRYTAAVAAVSIWEDHLGPALAELSDVELTRQDVTDVMHLFGPTKNPEDGVRIDVTSREMSFTAVRGMVEMSGDRQLTLPRPTVDEFPDVRRMVAGGITRAVALLESAEDAGTVDGAAVDEVFAAAQMTTPTVSWSRRPPSWSSPHSSGRRRCCNGSCASGSRRPAR